MPIMAPCPRATSVVQCLLVARAAPSRYCHPAPPALDQPNKSYGHCDAGSCYGVAQFWHGNAPEKPTTKALLNRAELPSKPAPDAAKPWHFPAAGAALAE